MSDEFEGELRAAMQQAGPPAGFADSVMQRVAAADTRHARVLAFPPPARRWAVGALAAALLAGTAADLAVRAHQRREADREFVLAMRVTNHALEQTRQQLSRAGIRLAD